MCNKSIKPEPDKSIDDLIILEDDDLIFLEEESEEQHDQASPSSWKILVVDVSTQYDGVGNDYNCQEQL
ncbi:hypothetical protein, partial [Dapis sp. BLCC M229]|uniref:hypothetical protein n=1 Tax=Dapis sp. BLCC M229 TaxID=3400188 RepID=UPI003CE90AF0